MHIANNKRCFFELNTSAKGRVTVGNGAVVEAEGHGKCRLEFLDANNILRTAVMSNVYYIPKMTGNLLSVKQLTDKGFSMVFRKDVCELIKDGRFTCWFISFAHIETN